MRNQRCRLSFEGLPALVPFAAACLLASLMVACGGSEPDALVAAGSAGVPMAKMAEQSSRSLALVKPTPLYPGGSIENGVSGVAVAEILVNNDGLVDHVNVLQAPDLSIREAVRNALAKWEFMKVTPEEYPDGISFSSKLTFYFELENGQGFVRNPESIERERPEVTAARVKSGSAVRRIDEETFRDLTGRPTENAIVILDIRERDEFLKGHRDGAVNIPADEVISRAKQLPVSSHVVIDCFAHQDPFCVWVAGELDRIGFSEVSLLSAE